MKFFRKLQEMARRRRREAERAAEMQFHLEELEARHRAAGLSPVDAHYAALREFGNVAGLRQRARESVGWPALEASWRDLRLAVRRLGQRPGFTAVALTTLALGIGANTAIYSIVRGVVQRPLPYAEPERIMWVRETTPHNGGQPFSVSVPNFTDWRERSRSFEQLVAVAEKNMNLTGGGDPAQVVARRVSRGYLDLLGLRPQLGRDFRPEEDAPGANTVVLLSERFWRARFGGDAAVVGQTLQLDGRAHEIAGVAPDEAADGVFADLLVPLGADLAREERDNHEIGVLGRLRRGVSREAAEAELKGIAEQLGREHPASNAGWGADVQELRALLVPPKTRVALFVLQGAVGLLLMAAAVNLASMLLARAVEREKELAVCLALGTSGRRLMLQLLTESLTLAVLGGALGVLFAHWLVSAWHASWMAAAVPRADEVRVDGGVLAAATGLALLVGIVGGLAPALRARRVDVREALNATGRGASGKQQRVLRALIVAQVALSFCLLGAAGIFLRSWRELTRVDLGFAPQQVLTFKVAPAGDAVAFYDRLLPRLAGLPGVQAVGLSSGTPMDPFNTKMNVAPLGVSLIAAGKSVQAEWRVVRDDYFGALRVPLLRGRAFAPTDGERAPKVTVVNRSLARMLWGDENAVGRQIDIGGDGGEPATVIGVVGDVRSQHPGRAPEPAFYLSAHAWVWGHMTVTLRSTAEPALLWPLLRAEVAALDRNLPLFETISMERRVEESLGQSRMLALLVAGFGLTALLLAALGVGGVTAFAVGMRRREIGVRLALGAEPGQVLRLVQGENARLAALGVAVGGLLLLAGGRLMAGQLFGVSAFDPWAVSLSMVTVAATVWLAGWIPARRASRMDPLIALRSE